MCALITERKRIEKFTCDVDGGATGAGGPVEEDGVLDHDFYSKKLLATRRTMFNFYFTYLIKNGICFAH